MHLITVDNSLEQIYEFPTQDLWNPFGFDEGMLLESLTPKGTHINDFLYLVVNKLVVPKITSHEVEVELINQALFNPIKPITIDGMLVNRAWFLSKEPIHFEPTCFWYTGYEILSLLDLCNTLQT